MTESKEFQDWWNYKTKQYDSLTETPDSFEDYIQQDSASQALYALYQKTGDTPIQAATKVLEQWRMVRR